MVICLHNSIKKLEVLVNKSVSLSEFTIILISNFSLTADLPITTPFHLPAFEGLLSNKVRGIIISNPS